MDKHALTYLAGVQRKYSQPEEVEVYGRKVAEGLEPWEERLLIGHLKREDRILDLGCGAGREALALWRLGFTDLWGIDLSPSMVEAARGQAKALGANLVFEQGNILRPLPGSFPASYDAVLLMAQMFTHIPGQGQRLAVLDRVRGWLAPGGRVLLSTHNRYDGSVPRWRWKVDSAIWGLGRALGLTGREAGDILSPSVSEAESKGFVYMHIFEPGEIPALLSAAGLELVECLSNTEITQGVIDPVGRYRDRYVFYVARRPT